MEWSIEGYLLDLAKQKLLKMSVSGTIGSEYLQISNDSYFLGRKDACTVFGNIRQLRQALTNRPVEHLGVIHKAKGNKQYAIN